MSLDVVYYVRPGERNEELRYSLRSLRNLPHERVWMVGHKPRWVTGVEHIPGNLILGSGGAQAIAADNLRLACEAVPTDRFVVFNDDFYVMEPLKAVPAWHAGPLIERLGTARGSYANALREALRRLTALGQPEPIAWTLHIPVVVTRRTLAEVVADLLTAARRMVPEWRTMYGNLSGATGEQAPDVKVRYRRDPLPAGPFLSSHEAALSWLLPTLRRAFPTPSPYEA